MKDDRLNEMKIFKAVVDLGGFTLASHHFGVSQPFISKTITSLERRLGISLLQRNTRCQRITEEGVSYLNLVNDILAKLNEIDSWAYNCKNQKSPAGELRVSAPIAFGIDQIAKFIPEFVERYPAVEINLSLSDYYENLLDGSVDIAIRMGKLNDSSLISKKLCDLNRVLVASREYLLSHPQIHSPDDLKNHNCLMWSGGKEHLNKWPFRLNEEHRVICVRGNVKSSNGLALMNMCYLGMGIMRMAEHVALPSIKSGLIEPILTDYHIKNDDGIYAVFPAEKKESPRVRAFLGFMSEKLRLEPWKTE